MKSTAWAFLAVSSLPQAETLDSQQQWAQKTAKAHGWKITRTWKGTSSGKGGVRPLLADLLADLRATPSADRPNRILLVRIDRLGRGDGLDTMAAIAELKRLGVTLHTRDDGDVRLQTASDSVLPAIKAIMAAVENETRADRVRAGHARRRAAGKHLGMIPYGTVLVAGKPVAYEPEAAIVREVFELLAQGWGLERIASFVRPKAPPKRLGDGSERRLTWGTSTIRSLYESTVVRSAVVDPDLLARAMAARKDNYRYRPTGEWEWPLRGAVRCMCGGTLIGHATGTNPHRVRYYRCRSHPYDLRGPGNSSPSHRADALEASFLYLLRSLTADPGLLTPPTRATPLEALQAKETALRQNLARLETRRGRACELAEEGVYTSADLRERLARIDDDWAKLAAELRDVRVAISDAGSRDTGARQLRAEIAEWPERWQRATIERKQAFARAIAAALGGLYADPNRKGVIVPGIRVPKARKAKTKSTNVSRGALAAAGSLIRSARL